MSSEGRKAWSRCKWFRGPFGKSLASGSELALSQSLGDASTLNVDFSADLSSPPLPRSLFSLNAGLLCTFMPRQHYLWIRQCAGNVFLLLQSRAG